MACQIYFHIYSDTLNFTGKWYKHDTLGLLHIEAFVKNIQLYE